jgi:hypothetical protein
MTNSSCGAFFHSRAFRDYYGFVDHVEIIPPGQLLRVPSHLTCRSVLVDYLELHLAPRILPLVIATTLEYVSTICTLASLTS